MKILIANDTYYPHVNGSSYFTQRLARCLKDRGHDVVVIAPSMSLYNTKTTVNNIAMWGVWSIPILFYKQFRFCLPPFFIKYFIENSIKEFKPDIVHIQGHFFVGRTVLSIAKKHGIPVIATNHFMPDNLTHYLHLPRAITAYINTLLWNDFSRVFNRADYITTPTRSAALLLPPLRIPAHVISNGIDLNLFKKSNTGEYLKQRFHLSEQPILLYVGRLDREKNLDVVIAAMARLEKRDNIQFVVAGTGAEQKRLKSLVAQYSLEDVVKFVGFVPDIDLPNLYAIASCFINAGTAELQSIVTMEAMATGLPVIAVRALALPELVREGKNGYLFADRDDASLAEYIKKIFVVERLRHTMGAESLKIIEEHDIKKTLGEFEALYTSLVAQSA